MLQIYYAGEWIRIGSPRNLCALVLILIDLEGWLRIHCKTYATLKIWLPHGYFSALGLQWVPSETSQGLFCDLPALYLLLPRTKSLEAVLGYRCINQVWGQVQADGNH